MLIFLVWVLQVFNGISDFILLMGEIYVFKIKNQFTKHGFGKKHNT